ncbi:lasso peptide biosynthesis PqqD family chaperone [Paenibacillus sp. SYP-B3998]|uniref:Lasso peptide biosynthesis PqqD family chaperone n=1 Tax=Paenibacillus sp. SYP-B3998 TaxID=2678564 RepID=A0A6G3ZYE5_9BACL|nr:lasso peptide biosynthesis PqqD family chaperone [Paenibacillus sp. SYP-B3998]NEW07135.1 lasso peptide biosynthesis PqqD family chaperone [Paenibacillus sp. SYP-B3998]
MSIQPITREHIVVQNEGNLVSNMDGEKVMLSIASGKYYNLGVTGGRIWELIELPKSVEEIVATLESEFDIEASLCEEQVRSFLELLSKEGLIQIREE